MSILPQLKTHMYILNNKKGKKDVLRFMFWKITRQVSQTGWQKKTFADNSSRKWIEGQGVKTKGY